MRSIDMKVVSKTSDSSVLELLIDDKSKGNIVITNNNGIGTIETNFNKNLFMGAYGAILLNEILTTTLFFVENLYRTEIYMPEDDVINDTLKICFNVKYEDKDATKNTGCYYLEK